MPKRNPVKLGEMFGKLTVIAEGRHRSDGKGHLTYISVVVCSCGIGFEVRQSSLRDGNTTSCGCTNRENFKMRDPTTHGMSKTSTYKSWASMKMRCNNPNLHQFKDWGGRGISYCPEWESFVIFCRDMGERPGGYSLDRIDNNGDYNPQNCRWADRRMQAFNQSQTKRVVFADQEMSFSEACRRLGRSTATVSEYAEKLGISVQQAVLQYKKVRRTKADIT